jgi:fatty acid desaturase
MTEDTNEYETARRYVRARRALREHALTYLIVMTILFLLDLAMGDGWWFYWPALGWGIGLALHTASVFGGWADGSAEEREIRRYMERHRPA